jgi:hypothetical protein
LSDNWFFFPEKLKNCDQVIYPILYLLNKKEVGKYKNRLVQNILFVIVFIIIVLINFPLMKSFWESRPVARAPSEGLSGHLEGFLTRANQPINHF